MLICREAFYAAHAHVLRPSHIMSSFQPPRNASAICCGCSAVVEEANAVVTRRLRHIAPVRPRRPASHAAMQTRRCHATVPHAACYHPLPPLTTAQAAPRQRQRWQPRRRKKSAQEKAYSVIVYTAAAIQCEAAHSTRCRGTACRRTAEGEVAPAKPSRPHGAMPSRFVSTVVDLFISAAAAPARVRSDRAYEARARRFAGNAACRRHA